MPVENRSARSARVPNHDEVRCGFVIAKSAEVGTGYLAEQDSANRFAFARRFVGAEAFDALRVGSKVLFKDNGQNAVTEFFLD